MSIIIDIKIREGKFKYDCLALSGFSWQGYYSKVMWREYEHMEKELEFPLVLNIMNGNKTVTAFTLGFRW